MIENESGGAILVLASTYPRYAGDTEPAFVHELSKRLALKRRVIVVAPCAPGAAPRETLDAVEIIRYRYAPRRFETLVNNGGIGANLRASPWKWLLVPSFLISQLLVTAYVLATRRVGVVHAHWLIPQGVLAATLCCVFRKAPLVVTTHGADVFTFRGRALSMVKRWAARRSTRILAVSASLRDAMVRLGIPREKIGIGPMGTDLQHRFVPAIDVNRAACEILFVGRFVEKKGVRHLLKAMPHVLDRYPDAILTLIGGGSLEKELKAQVETLNIASSVRFLGPMPSVDLPNFYRRAAVFVAPFVRAISGDDEGLGLVVVEALGCACPIVIGKTAALGEVLGPVAREIQVDAADHRALADAIVEVFKHPEKAARRTELLRQRILTQLDWDRVAANYLEALRCAESPMATRD